MDKLELAEIVQNVPVIPRSSSPPPTPEPPGKVQEDLSPEPDESYSDGGADIPWSKDKEEEIVAPAPRSKSTKRKSGD